MCCSKRKQQRHLVLQQQLLLQPQVLPRQRGCCGARRQRRLLEAAVVNPQNETQVSEVAHPVYFESNPRGQRPPTMAAMIAVGIGLGAEKLGRKISEKRLERKEKKSAAVYIPLVPVYVISLSLTKIRNVKPSIVPPSLQQRACHRIGPKAGMRESTGRVKRRDVNKSMLIDGGA